MREAYCRRALFRGAREAEGDAGMSKSSREQLTQDLLELIEAIDRRLPRLDHVQEPAIAQEAAALRARAVELLDDLKATVRRIAG
jgi:hypothetical protein